MSLTPEQWIQLAVYLSGQAIVIAVLKNDLKWLRQSLEKHEASDGHQFETVRDDIKDLRAELRLIK